MIDPELKRDLLSYNAQTRLIAMLELGDLLRGRWPWEPGEITELGFELIDWLRAPRIELEELEAILRNLIEMTQYGQPIDMSELPELLPRHRPDTGLMFDLYYLSGEPKCYAEFQTYLNDPEPSVRRRAAEYLARVAKL